MLLFSIYTRYLDNPPCNHGIIECPDEHTAMVYAYETAAKVLLEHENDAEVSCFNDFHDALFSTVEFWIE